MNLYAWLFIFSFLLLSFLFYLRSGLRKKLSLKMWIEKLETIARDNHTLWATQIPYSQKQKICKELTDLEKEQKQSGLFLKISEAGDWTSSSDLLKYPSIKRLFKKILPQIISYSRNLGLDPRLLTLSAFASINRQSSEILKEAGEDPLFSGCYFLQGSTSSQADLCGVSFYKKEMPDCLLARFQPHPGDLLLYPSDMLQKIDSYQGEKERICITFHLHFGNRKRSWMISKIPEPEFEKEADTVFDPQEEKSISKYLGDANQLSQLSHISKIKKIIF